MKVSCFSVLMGWLALASLAGAQNPPRIVPPPGGLRPQPQIAPSSLITSFQVVRGKVPDEMANRLGILLKVAGKLGLGDGSVRYISPRFMSLPTKAVDDATPNEERKPTKAFALLLDQLESVKAIETEKAQEQVLQALKAAQLDVPGATPVVGHTSLEISKTSGEPKKYDIDTYVGFNFKLGGIPLIGPGAKIRVAIAPNGETTQIRYAFRTLKQGPSVQMISPGQADRLVAFSLGTSPSNLAKLKKSLVYYAPPIELGTVQNIVPHYLYSGSFQVEKETFQVRDFLVPAVANAPQAKVDASTQGGSVLARATINGGRAPYSFSWTSSGSPTVSNQQVFQYGSKSRSGGDVITLVVTDADGLRSIVRSRVTRTPSEVFFASFEEEAEPEPVPARSIPRIDVGAEYVGATYADIGQPALGLTAGNASGFVVSMAMNAVPAQFFWGERDAWETDFKASTAGGDDTHFSDDVDMMFFTGHANNNSFLVSSSNSDTNIVSGDPRWGDRDAEWIVIAACGPLQVSPTLNTRWGPTFQGLHAILGYATNSADTAAEGSTLVNYMKGFRFLNILMLPPQTVVVSWLATGIDIQGSGVTIGAMGPIRSDGVTNMNDFFWNAGSVGPDIPASRITGFWVVRTGC